MSSFFNRPWSDSEKWGMGIISAIIIAILLGVGAKIFTEKAEDKKINIDTANVKNNETNQEKNIIALLNPNGIVRRVIGTDRCKRWKRVRSLV